MYTRNIVTLLAYIVTCNCYLKQCWFTGLLSLIELFIIHKRQSITNLIGMREIHIFVVTLKVKHEYFHEILSLLT